VEAAGPRTEVMPVSLIWVADAVGPEALVISSQKVGFNQVKRKEVREMAIASFPSVGAFGHRSRRRSADTEVAEPVIPPAVPRSASVRVLRTPEELSEAISRAQEFERHNAELTRNRSQRYRNALSVPDGTAMPSPAAVVGPDGDSVAGADESGPLTPNRPG
jgi:hypothetical protein